MKGDGRDKKKQKKMQQSEIKGNVRTNPSLRLCHDRTNHTTVIDEH